MSIITCVDFHIPIQAYNILKLVRHPKGFFLSTLKYLGVNFFQKNFNRYGFFQNGIPKDWIKEAF